MVVLTVITTTFSGWLPRKNVPPRNTPDSFCRLFHPTKSFACTAWAVFFFFTNKILCSCANLRNSFLVVDCTTSKCYSCAWKKQDVVSALRPTFFIPNLESFISRLNEILRHDLTLSVGEPDNAAAQTGAGTSFGANGDQHTRAVELSTYFYVLTIRKQLLGNDFERSGRGQEPSRGHKFSILENVLSIRDFTSQTLASFPSDLVGACLPQTLPSNNKVHNCSMDWV